MSDLDKYLVFAKDLALEAGQIMLKYFDGSDVNTEVKKDLSHLTKADTEINNLVIKRIKSVFPTHGVLGEEKSYRYDRNDLWVVDPIDGTSPFVLGIPVSVFSLALLENGQPKVAVVYDPYTKRFYSAIAGSGAYENDKKLDVSDHKVGARQYISSDIMGGVDWAIFSDPAIYGLTANALNPDGKTTIYHLPYVYALILVAAGRLDLAISSNKKPWDLAASGLIASEAGAKVTDIFGKSIPRFDQDTKGCCVAAPIIHKRALRAVLPILKDSKPQ